MTIIIQSHNTAQRSIQKKYGDVLVLDVTGQGPEPWKRFSPFYPHDHIPVPFSPGYTSKSVEGIWQGLKVFSQADIDISKFSKATMSGLKRSSSYFGMMLGHREGVHGTRLLPYIEARYAIYLPSYHWILEHNLQKEIAQLRELAANKTVILLDFDMNGDINNASTPLSHASLIKRYIDEDWPDAN
jgi:hypothetical protein